MKSTFRFFLLLMLSVATASAATYYVDFAGGDNKADGLSPKTAWKHSPGDMKGTGNPRAAKLEAGDTVRFKGGVQYFGEIVLRVSGSEGKPIVFDGNADGTYGEGRAILDGAQMISGWQPVTSAEQVKGNPRWKEIMYVDLDVDISSNFNHGSFVLHRGTSEALEAPWQRIFLIDGDRSLLPIAQHPKPSDPFYPDLPADFLNAPDPVTISYPHKVYYEEGSRGNPTLPLINITNGGVAPVIQPFNGGAVSVEMSTPAPIAEMGFKLFRPTSVPVPEQIVFYVDDVEVLKVEVDKTQTEMQRFKLPETVEATKLTYQLVTSDPDAPGWTKFGQISAYTPEGENVIEHELSSTIRDEERFTQEDADWYDGAFIGVHGGNNHVYFAKVDGYDSATNALTTGYFGSKIYDTTSYALYNSPKFIELPGEWSIEPLDGGKTRVFLLPSHLANGQPVNIGYPVLKTGITLDSMVSHIDIKGFLVQRYAGGIGGIATVGSAAAGPTHFSVTDCEVRFISGGAGINLRHSDYVVVEDNYVHHCPGWTVGIYVQRINHYSVSRNRLDTNSGSGIRHYESTYGVLKDNVVLNHYGMHSSGINFYEGCAEILFEGNYVQNTMAINRNAVNMVFRNNVFDAENRNVFNVTMWAVGNTGGEEIKNVLIENNTLVNLDHEIAWWASFFVQEGKPNPPEGLVFRNNILSRIRPLVKATIEDNIFMVETTEGCSVGTGAVVETDANVLFRDPENGDYRRKEGGPLMSAGADIAPPSKTWQR